jgi:hypothetical protein
MPADGVHHAVERISDHAIDPPDTCLDQYLDHPVRHLRG